MVSLQVVVLESAIQRSAQLRRSPPPCALRGAQCTAHFAHTTCRTPLHENCGITERIILSAGAMSCVKAALACLRAMFFCSSRGTGLTSTASVRRFLQWRPRRPVRFFSLRIVASLRSSRRILRSCFLSFCGVPHVVAAPIVRSLGLRPRSVGLLLMDSGTFLDILFSAFIVLRNPPSRKLGGWSLKLCSGSTESGMASLEHSLLHVFSTFGAHA